MIASWLENYDKSRQYVEMQTHYSADERFVIVKAVVSLVVVHSCESWTVKKAEHQRSPLDGKEIKPVNLEGNQP